jgi:ppGpp synthetase/RelA/SpoT-type nucleotidyltranferase
MERSVTQAGRDSGKGPLKWTDAGAQFAEKRPLYELFADEMCRILTESFNASNLKCQSIDGRAKSVDSFDKKCRKTKDDGTLKYTSPLTEITDLAGVRVIVYTLKDLERIAKFLGEYFSVKERKDIGEERFDKGAFGYQSIHYLVAFSDARASLPDSSKYKGLICEVQVRTVLQHAWAEIEHDVQYKTTSELPKTIRKKFLSLAGLLEIADREFQSIHDEDEKLKGNILEGLQDELTQTALAESKEGSYAAAMRPETQPIVRQGVRALLLEGRLKEAIELYDRKIASEPESYTLYVGRSKAKFLSGDTGGSLKDLLEAETLSPSSPAVDKLRKQIAGGEVTITAPPDPSTNSNDLQKKGKQALSEGRGEEAYREFSLAQAAGASWPFSIVNKAMSCLVARDYEGARINIERLRIVPGTPMEITIKFIVAALDVLEQRRNSEQCCEELRILVARKGDYSFVQSPLAALKDGLNVTFDDEEKTNLNHLFSCLQ